LDNLAVVLSFRLFLCRRLIASHPKTANEGHMAEGQWPSYWYCKTSGSTGTVSGGPMFTASTSVLGQVGVGHFVMGTRIAHFSREKISV
jgi:hypothetical protein